MRTQISRPKAPSKKISCHDEFELCYLRHQYLRRVKYNPTDIEMAPFYPIIKHLSKKTFFTYHNLFQMVGFEPEDIVNIGKTHLVSYLGLFSITNVPEKYDQFIDTFYVRHRDYPTDEDILNKEKANFTMFLKQRFEDVVRICRQKARNIKGLPTEEYMVYYGKNPPPEEHRLLDEDNESLGYKKLDISVFKTRKKSMTGQKGPVYQHKGLYYVTVPVENRTLSIVDFISAGLDPRDASHNMNPEEKLLELDALKDFESKKEEFFSRSVNYRTRKIKQFIALHKDNPSYNDEVRAARIMLKSKGL